MASPSSNPPDDKLLDPGEADLRFKRPAADCHCWHCHADNAVQKCSRCSLAKYCNRTCQAAHWKEHKLKCKPYKSEDEPKPISLAPPNFAEPGLFTKMIADMKAGRGTFVKCGPNDSVQKCETCGVESKCISAFESPISSGNYGHASANAIFLCPNGHSSTATDCRLGLTQMCSCKIEVEQIKVTLTEEQEAFYRQTVSPTNRLLIVTGFDRWKTGDALYYTKFTPELDRAGIPYDVLMAEDGPVLTERLLTNTYSAVMFIHLDYKGFRRRISMFDSANLSVLYVWITLGGKFIMHGEGEEPTWVLQKLTGKPWHHCGDYYRRAKHSCNRKTFVHFPLRAADAVVPALPTFTTGSDASAATAVTAGNNSTSATASTTANPSLPASTSTGADSDCDDQLEGDRDSDVTWLLPKSINMKATMLCGVAPPDRLFSPLPGARVVSAIPGFGGHVINPDRTAVAYTKVGEGSVCFVGDVNAEVKTMKTLIALLQLP